MNQGLQKYVEAATGITSLTKTQAEKIVKQMVKQGEAARDQAGDLVEDLLAKSRDNRESLKEIVKSETQRVIGTLGLASQSEVERLNEQVAELKKKLAEAEKAGTKPAAAKSPAKKTAKKAAKKSTAKKSTAKKSTAKKSTAKKAAKKATTKKAAKKSTSTKTAKTSS